MEEIVVSGRERRRLEILSRVKADEISIKKASEVLGTSCRQTSRIYKRYCAEGDEGLVHEAGGNLPTEVFRRTGRER